VAESHEQRRTGARRRIREKRLQGRIGGDVPRSDDRRGVGKERRFRQVAAYGRDGSEIVERLVQGCRGGGAGFLGSDR
jgi:hypothetical protein